MSVAEISNTIVVYTKLTCPVCGVHYAIDTALYTNIWNKGGHWYCANGHNLIFIESKAERIQKQLDATTKQLQAAKDNEIYYRNRVEEIHSEKQAVEVELKGTRTQLKGTKTKLRNSNTRHAAGVCPCCQRTFKQLVQHMANKHPDYKTEE